MEENVALDSKKQKKFVKSIRGIKKLIKKNEGKANLQKKDEKVEPKKPFSMKLRDGKISKKKWRKERGLVYLSHIPHGFYEHQMTQYFKQFGVVTNVRVIRSKRTGNSKGFAFVEFKEPAVGQIVAETMNNYLMGKRLIKAAYIPPEKQKHKAFRKHWNSVNNPTSQMRLKTKKEFNADKDEIGELKRARKLLSNLNKNRKKLREIGVNYDFFAPVDVPEALLNDIVKQEKDDTKSVKEESKPNKTEKDKENKRVLKNEAAENGKQIKETKEKKNNKNQKGNKPDVVKKGKEAELTKKDKQAEVKKSKPVEVKKGNQSETKSVSEESKKEKLPVKVNEKQQKEKEQKLKKAGVKPAEFIKVAEDSDEDNSDSEYEFDSDAYDKMLEKMSENSELSFLSDEDDESGDNGEESEDDGDSDTEEAPPKLKGKPMPKVVQPVPPKKQAQKQLPQNLLTKKKVQKKPVEAKRKAPKEQAVSPKKAKFEKQSQKSMKKQFKKK